MKRDWLRFMGGSTRSPVHLPPEMAGLCWSRTPWRGQGWLMGSYLGNQEDQKNLSAASQTRAIQVWEKTKSGRNFCCCRPNFARGSGGSDSVIQNMHIWYMVYGYPKAVNNRRRMETWHCDCVPCWFIAFLPFSGHVLAKPVEFYYHLLIFCSDSSAMVCSGCTPCLMASCHHGLHSKIFKTKAKRPVTR